MQRHIDLIIPGLCGPLPEFSEFHDSEVLSSFISLWGKTSKLETGIRSYPEQLCSIMGVDLNPVPEAELSLLAYGIKSEGYHWMHADPVHMIADVDHVVLYDSHSLNLDSDESNALLSDLNHHFEQDEIEFVVADANHWFVKSKKVFDVTTVCLNNAVMQNINQLMPYGKDSVFFKKLLNESQMLLHLNPVNEKRENNGLLTANSLWFWGEGVLTDNHESAVKKCSGNNVLLKGMSRYLNVEYVELGSVESLITRCDDDGTNLVVIDDLMTACSYGDASNWLSSFETMYKKFLEPFIAHALKNKLTIHCYPCNGFCHIINSTTKYRFWRSTSLEKYFECDENTSDE